MAVDLVWVFLTFGLGIGLLVKGSDWLVDASARIGKQFGLSNFVIGLTIVALGTSLPELGTSVVASLYQNSDLILGNIIGSNIANLALILGLAGMYVPIAVKKDIYMRDGLMMLFATFIFYAASWDGIFTALEGGIFIVMFITYIGYFIATKRVHKREFHFRKYLHEYSDLKKRERFDKAPKIAKNAAMDLRQRLIQDGVNFERGIVRFVKGLLRHAKDFFLFFLKLRNLAFRKRVALYFLFRQVGMLLLGAICLFFGARFVVESAMQLPFDQLAIGLVLVAVGTSLPELAVTISSLRKGIPQIMIGNLIGSNIANILWVGGVSAMISPIVVPSAVINFDFIFLLLVSWLFLVFLRNDYKITRIEAFSMFLFYILFVATVFGMRMGV